ncbi:MAG TPA: hypothetical protein VF458_03125 [Ktedonobacteraceae bacterium]
MNIADFAAQVLGKPLYPYQLEVAEAILQSMQGGYGRIISVMMARQSGKNQLSAVLEAYVLATHEAGAIVKAAPTFRPQIRNSHERLARLLRESSLGERVWSNAAMIGLAPGGGTEREKQQQGGPRVLFYSASPGSNVVGATADLLLEIDEAQDVDWEKFNRDFRPMAATGNTTTVLYGTAWSDATLLARQRAANLSAEETTGIRAHFEYDWRHVAAHNPAYRTFVEREIERLGEEHPLIQTQYCLRSLDGAGYLLNSTQRALLQGQHAWREEPDEDELGAWYVAGLDVGGEERPDPGALSSALLGRAQAGRKGHDSSVFTIGRVRFNEFSLPCLEIVHQQCWTGRPHLEQYAGALSLVERWHVRVLVIDSTGLGEGLASLLVSRLGAERVRTFRFTQPSKSHLAFQLLGLINGGRLSLPMRSSAPLEIYDECWRQLCQARYRLPAPDRLDMYVDPADGHDDYLMSLALLTEALTDVTPPALSTSIRPRRLYTGEGRF